MRQLKSADDGMRQATQAAILMPVRYRFGSAPLPDTSDRLSGLHPGRTEDPERKAAGRYWRQRVCRRRETGRQIR